MSEQKKTTRTPEESEAAAKKGPMEDSEAEGVVGGVHRDPDTRSDGSFVSRFHGGGSMIKGPGAGE